MDPENNFEVTDKRRVHVDAPDEAAPQPAEPAETVADAPAGSPAEAAAGTPADPLYETADADDDPAAGMPAMDVYSLLTTTISMLASGAWSWMGLSPSPFTGKMERDMAQAKVAIDTVALLATQVDARLSDAERRNMQSLVSDLRVNYVQQSQRG